MPFDPLGFDAELVRARCRRMAQKKKLSEDEMRITSMILQGNLEEVTRNYMQSSEILTDNIRRLIVSAYQEGFHRGQELERKRIHDHEVQEREKKRSKYVSASSGRCSCRSSGPKGHCCGTGRCPCVKSNASCTTDCGCRGASLCSNAPVMDESCALGGASA